MGREAQIIGLAKLGSYLENFTGRPAEEYHEDEQELSVLVQRSAAENPWFTAENIKLALSNWAQLLTEETLVKWTKPYKPSRIQKRVGLILAGNIPLVGWHDVVSVILSGHRALIKLSSKDQRLIPFLLRKWQDFSEEKIPYEIVEKLADFDAVIATGSNNTARYLEYYFKDHPAIIRKNRTSVAVLSGKESDAELQNLGKDIFTYFGMGCRNVSRLFLPKKMELDRLFTNFTPYSDIINHHSYANNYDYHKAIYLLNGESFWDNNFVMIKEDSGLFTPLSVLYFSRYENLEEVTQFLTENSKDIQAVVAAPNLGLESVNFGEAQCPALDTYADNVDTMQFLEVI